MNDIDDIEVEIVEPEDIEEPTESEVGRKGIGLIPVVLLSTLAALFGALGGAYGAQFLTKSPDLLKVDSQIDRKTAELEDKQQKALASLKDEIAGLKNNVMQVQGGQASEEVLAVLQNRVDALEAAPLPEFPEIDPEIMTALQSAQADGFNWPDMTGVETKLEGLEKDYTDIAEQLRSVSERVEDLNDKALMVKPMGSSDLLLSKTLPTSSLEFPETALRDAAEQMVSKQGFFKRTMSKHIDVRDPSDPIVLIEKVKAALQAGDIDLAIKTFDTLPESIKEAGQEWRAAASKL